MTAAGTRYGFHAGAAKLTPRFRAALTNTAWLTIERGLQWVLQFSVGVWVIRYLGPGNFGVLSFAISIGLLASTVARFGLEALVTRDLALQREDAGQILSDALAVRLACGVGVSAATAIGATVLVDPAESATRHALLLMAILPLALALEPLQWWFNARTESRCAVWARSGGAMAAVALRIALLLFGAPVVMFAATVVVEASLASAASLFLFRWRRGPMPTAAQVEVVGALRLANRAVPLLVASLAVIVYMQTDIVMLNVMLGPEATGVYTVAARLSELWYFAPVVIVSSVNPALLQTRQANELLYLRRVRLLLVGLLAAASALAWVTTDIAGDLVRLLFGAAYGDAASVLIIHIWTVPLVAVGVVLTNALVNDGDQRSVMVLTVVSVLLNAVLNYTLIPDHGPIGAAYATLITQVAASCLFPLLISPSARQLVLVRRLVRRGAVDA
jgi:polysaccharide transporter, PST family